MGSFFIWLFIVFTYFINFTNCEEIVINVGDHGLRFSPQNATARVNDVIRWIFIEGSKHQIIQSSGPAGNCNNSIDPNLFVSTLQEGGEFTYTITQTSGTLYYFCAYSSHCQYGMWGTINIEQSSSIAIGQTASSPTPTITTPSTSDDNLPMIIGSAIGGFFALSILGLIAFMVYRRKKYQNQFKDQAYDTKNTDGGDGNGGATESISTLVNTGLARSNTRGEPNQEVIMTKINDRDQETIRSFDEIPSEYAVSIGNRISTKSDAYSYRPYSDVDPRLSSISHYDNERQPPVVPPRPYNTGSSQFGGAPYVPPRPSVVNKYSPQHGPSLTSYRDTQYSTSSEPYGIGNIQYYQPNDVLPQHTLPPPSQPLPPAPTPPHLHPPLLHPPPSQPLPPPPSQQQTGQYYG